MAGRFDCLMSGDSPETPPAIGRGSPPKSTPGGSFGGGPGAAEGGGAGSAAGSLSELRGLCFAGHVAVGLRSASGTAAAINESRVMGEVHSSRRRRELVLSESEDRRNDSLARAMKESLRDELSAVDRDGVRQSLEDTRHRLQTEVLPEVSTMVKQLQVSRGLQLQ